VKALLHAVLVDKTCKSLSRRGRHLLSGCAKADERKNDSYEVSRFHAAYQMLSGSGHAVRWSELLEPFICLARSGFRPPMFPPMSDTCRAPTQLPCTLIIKN
jgi:hypothetical protein